MGERGFLLHYPSGAVRDKRGHWYHTFSTNGILPTIMALVFSIRVRRGFSAPDRTSYGSLRYTVLFCGGKIFGMIKGWCAAEFREDTIVVCCFWLCVREHLMRQGPTIF